MNNRALLHFQYFVFPSHCILAVSKSASSFSFGLDDNLSCSKDQINERCVTIEETLTSAYLTDTRAHSLRFQKQKWWGINRNRKF